MAPRPESTTVDPDHRGDRTPYASYARQPGFQPHPAKSSPSDPTWASHAVPRQPGGRRDWASRRGGRCRCVVRAPRPARPACAGGSRYRPAPRPPASRRAGQVAARSRRAVGPGASATGEAGALGEAGHQRAPAPAQQRRQPPVGHRPKLDDDARAAWRSGRAGRAAFFVLPPAARRRLCRRGA